MNRDRFLAVGLVSLIALSSVAGLGLALSAPDRATDAPASHDGPVHFGVPSDAVVVRDAGTPDADVRGTDATSTNDAPTPKSAVDLVTTRETITFDAAKDQVIRGESSLPVGSELVIVIASDEPEDYVSIDTTRVGLDGTFRQGLDFSAYPANATVNVVVLHEGTRVEETTARVTPEESDTRIDAEWNELDVEAGHETITGSTDLPAGTELNVTVSSAGDYRYDRTRTVSVREDGTFEATFDLSSMPHATDFRVSVDHDGHRLDYVTGTVYR